MQKFFEKLSTMEQTRCRSSSTARQPKAASPREEVIDVAAMRISFCHVQHTHIATFLLDFTDFGKAISASFGGDCTVSAIENRFRRIKSDAKLINDALKKGIDPITLPIGGSDGSVAPKSSKNGHGQAAFTFFIKHTNRVSLPFVLFLLSAIEGYG